MSRSTIQRWLKLSSAYAESPLRVGCLEWPLRISPSHALQLQAAAAIRALSPVKSRHSQVSKQSLSKIKVGLFPSLSPPVLLRQSNATVISTELLSWCMHSIMKCYVYIVQINGDSCSMLCTCIVKLLDLSPPPQPGSSGLLLYSVPSKSLNPTYHDSGVWSDALRISSHISNTSPRDTEDTTPSLLLEVYRLARKQGNLSHAKELIQRKIGELCNEDVPFDINLTDACEKINSSGEIDPFEKLRINRELAKWHTSRGQPSVGIDQLSATVVQFCQTQEGAATLRRGTELTARSLLTMVKWLQADSRLMQSVWSMEHETGHRLQRLLNAEYECRKNRVGLYKLASATESCDLFKPDESVARFDKHEYAIGQLVHLATIHSPNLAKAWWSLAGWCYRIGRKNLEALTYVCMCVCMCVCVCVCVCV